jgi:hypothetical protein
MQFQNTVILVTFIQKIITVIEVEADQKVDQ